MNANVKAVVEACNRGSEEDCLNFGQVLGKLAEAGVEGYYADFRRSTKTYYLPDGESIEVQAHDPDVAITSAFDAGRVEAAVRLSQAGTHTYRAFCEKVMTAGCSGYLVSLLGRRVVYFGRTAETHVEHFPNK
ncbi:MAG: DUF1398 family protein [Rhodoglobus sp.]|nr:DUF1398 family protein [Rhodoglobus sp.]